MIADDLLRSVQKQIQPFFKKQLRIEEYDFGQFTLKPDEKTNEYICILAPEGYRLLGCIPWVRYKKVFAIFPCRPPLDREEMTDSIYCEIYDRNVIDHIKEAVKIGASEYSIDAIEFVEKFSN